MPTLAAHRQLGARGIKSMLAVPVSFVSEHIETLEEIDMEYRWGQGPAVPQRQPMHQPQRGAAPARLRLQGVPLSLAPPALPLMPPCAAPTPGRELAEHSGIRNWGRVPALNTNKVTAHTRLLLLPWGGV